MKKESLNRILRKFIVHNSNWRKTLNFILLFSKLIFQFKSISPLPFMINECFSNFNSSEAIFKYKYSIYNVVWRYWITISNSCLAKNECSQVKYMVDTPRYFETLEKHLLYIPICPSSKQFAFVKFWVDR